MKAIFVGLVLTLCLVGCGTPKINGIESLEKTPAFNIKDFFSGNVKAWGIVQDRSGNLTQRFEVDIIGTLEDQTLTLDETFRYAVGEGVTKRVWRLSETAPGKWSGTAGDILDTASGESFGNAFFWTYRMDLPVGDTQYRVRFDDWIWAFDSDTIVNRSYIRKFGITFAEVTIFMQKQT